MKVWFLRRPLSVSRSWLEQQRRAEMKTQPEAICWNWSAWTSRFRASVVTFQKRKSA